MAGSWWRRLAQQLSSSSSAQDRRRRKQRRDFYRPRLEALEERALLAVRTWDGGALLNDNWTDASNWEGNVAPVANDELIFPEAPNIGILDRSTNNDFPIGTQFNKITMKGNNYTLSGNRITAGDGGLLQLPSSALTGESVLNTIELNITLPGPIVAEVLTGPALSSRLILEGGLSGPGGIEKEGDGSLEFTGNTNNSYSGTTRVNDGILVLGKSGVAVGGPLIIGDFVNSPDVILLAGGGANQIADTSPVTIRTLGTLDLNGKSEAIGPLSLLDGSIAASGPGGKLTLKGDVTSSGGTLAGNIGLGKSVVKFNVVGSTLSQIRLTVNGAISGTSILEKLGSGDLSFDGGAPNTYSGETRVLDGDLFLSKLPGVTAIAGRLTVGDGIGVTGFSESVRLSAPDQIADTAAVTVNRPGILVGASSDTIGPLTLNGGTVTLFSVLTLNGSVATLPSAFPATIVAGIDGQLDLGSSSRTFSVADGAAAQDLVISAKIVGANSGLEKTNGGTLVLANQNTQGQSTKLSNGTLLINGTHVNSSIIVNGSLAVLGGTGTIAGVTLNGGTIDPGLSPGLLTVNSLSTPVGSFAKFRFEINGLAAGTEFDQLKVAGISLFEITLDLSGNPTLNVSLGGGFSPALGTQFKIIDIAQASAPPAQGVFKSPQGVLLNEGAALTVNGQTFVISYVGGDGNDVVLTRDNPPAFQNRRVTSRIQEGGIATLTGTITEPDAGDTFFLDVNWGDGSAKETFTFPPGSPRNVSVTHKYLDDNPSVTLLDRYNIHLLWRDQHGGSNKGTLPIIVANVAPTLSNLAFGSPVVQGQLATLSGLISDPGVRDTFKLLVIWGDGSAPETFNFPAGTTSFSLPHRFTRSGYRAITLLLKDDDNGVKVATTRVKVNPPAVQSLVGSLAHGEGEAAAALNPAAVNALFAQDPLAFAPLRRARRR